MTFSLNDKERKANHVAVKQNLPKQGKVTGKTANPISAS